ncbi:DNA polymerase III beta subunit, central domain-containing protein [Ditylenchus destructor]|uniref:DNA polymerase III beta subunit, central domain-containing protein n=1 Tax=Ditylenchus destructor TaxID=166010 RepID=A0AAD4MG82_9BILA|nr:DNA polymerase III beta subunit, central domain-containing protein [Ditylenchus destructor]
MAPCKLIKEIGRGRRHIVLKATQDKVLAALQSVAGIVERRHTLPILANIRTTAELGGDDGQLHHHHRRAQADRHPAHHAGRPDRDLESSASKLVLKGGKSRFTLQSLPAEDFPLVQEAANFGPVFSVPQKTLKDLLSQVSFAMAVHDIRYYLNGILFVAEGKQLSLVATDGHRLAFSSATLDVEVPRQEVILPRKTVLEMQRLLSDAEGAIEMHSSPSWSRASSPTTTASSRKTHKKHRHAGPRAFAGQPAAHRHPDQREVQGRSPEHRAGTLRIASNNAEQEEAQDELDIDYGGDTIEIGFNVTYLIDALSNMDQDRFKIDLADSNSSALLTIPRTHPSSTS